MKMVGKRALNQRTADVLGRVTHADDVIVTERGKAHRRVRIVRVEDTVLARLERNAGG